MGKRSCRDGSHKDLQRSSINGGLLLVEVVFYRQKVLQTEGSQTIFCRRNVPKKFYLEKGAWRGLLWTKGHPEMGPRRFPEIFYKRRPSIDGSASISRLQTEVLLQKKYSRTFLKCVLQAERPLFVYGSDILWKKGPQEVFYRRKALQGFLIDRRIFYKQKASRGFLWTKGPQQAF